MHSHQPVVVIFCLIPGPIRQDHQACYRRQFRPGRLEAGYWLMSLSILSQTMVRIILPQALKSAFPPLSNSLIGLVKGYVPGSQYHE